MPKGGFFPLHILDDDNHKSADQVVDLSISHNIPRDKSDSGFYVFVVKI